MDTKPFLTLHELAEKLNLPAPWLRAEALAGRIPALRIGRKLRFDAVAVEEALRRRASLIERRDA